jgi:RES domain
VLYRAFPSLPGAGPTDEGGPLFVPRLDQGRGRHDNPDAYGALYLSRVPASPVAEVLRDYLARRIPPSPLLREGSPIALVTVAEDDLDLIDLDDPRVLSALDLRPSGIATHDRETTQPLARRLYDEGASGLEWWSTIEASWINVTLFADRAVGRLSVVDEPESLTIDHPVVEAAAEAVGVVLR